MDSISSIRELILLIASGLISVRLDSSFIFPSFYEYLLLLYAVRSGKYVVHINEEDGEITIKPIHVKEL